MAEESRGSASVEKKLKKKKRVAVQEAETATPEVEVKVKKKVKPGKAERQRIKNGETEAPSAEAVSGGKAPIESAADEAASKRSKKRKMSQSAGNEETKVPERPVDPSKVADDEERRSMQREIQQLVVRLRSEGKSKHEIEDAKYNLKKNFGKSLRNPDGAKSKKVEAWKQRENEKAEQKAKAEANAKAKNNVAAPEKTKEGSDDLQRHNLQPLKEVKDGAEAGAKEKGDRREEREKEVDLWKESRREGLEHKHDIVVIPVTWRGRHDEQEIEKAAAGVKAILSQQGLDVWVDSRRHYTPGQKFAHWEFRGVMLRIEIGPEDFNAGMLKLCRAKEAGDYKSVEKKVMRLPPRGSRKLLLQLKEWGLTQLDIEHRAADDDESEDDEPVEETGKAGAADAQDEDVAGNYKPRVSEEDPKKKGKKRRTT